MAKFNQLQAPVTNPAANKRLQDTQALRARAAVGQAQPGTNITQAAQQTGAALTQQAGQQALQQQQQQAGLAQSRAQNVMQAQQQTNQKDIFNRTQDLEQEKRILDDSLFNINQDAATQEQQMRTGFANKAAQQEFLQEQELADWALANAENEQDFRDRMQEMEQAHTKKNTMINQAYDVVIQDLKQQAAKADVETGRKLTEELNQIRAAWEAEKTKQKNEAANRQAMWSAGGAIVGAGIGAVLGGPAGAVAGGQAGAAAGTYVSTL